MSATAAVTVEQRPALLIVLSGDGQEGFAGGTLLDPIVVQVTDQGGTAVRGVVVSFAPGEGAGSVNPQNAVSDANGEASTEWTLGEGRFGSMSLRASVEQGAATLVSARAVPETPIPDLAIEGGLRPSREDPSTLETMEISLGVANLGNAATPAVFPLTFMVDGAVVETFEIAQLQPEQRATLTYTVGPFEAGAREITMILDAAEEIEEWTEDNNSASVVARVGHQQVIGPEQSVTVASSTVDEVLLFRVDITEAAQEALNVELSGGSGDADLFVNFEERPESQYDYECLSGNQATEELCQMVPTRVGSYHVAVHAYTAFGPSTLTVTVGGKPVETFDIEVVFLDNGTPSQDNIVREAAKRWESIIARGAQDFDFSISSDYNYPADQCFDGSPLVADVVDDLRVWVTIDSIDGPGGGKVPVQSGGIPGSSDGHWRESVFEDELLTPYLRPGRQPLSLVTIESLADLGYGVDLTEAESFTLSTAGAAGMAVPRGPVIYLGDDISRNPVTLIDQKGRFVGVYHNRRD